MAPKRAASVLPVECGLISQVPAKNLGSTSTAGSERPGSGRSQQAGRGLKVVENGHGAPPI